MRGASALGELIHKYPKADVQVIVVWEPVLPSDVGPPRDKVRRPLADPRVVEYWDPNLWMSNRAIRRAIQQAQAAGEEPPSEDDIAWDFVAIFPAGTSWDDPFPIPSWHEGPVVNALGPVEEALAGTPGTP